MLISFVIPMYNCGEYIATCIDSILDNALDESEYEVIVVDDGSADNGSDVVSQYTRQHKNVRLINQKNQGVGAARNTGKAAARGEYIEYVDADDTLAAGWPHHVARLVRDSGPDILFFEMKNARDTARITLEKTPDVIFEGSLKDYVARHGIQPSSCRCVFRREIANAFDFGKSKIGEDLEYMVRIVTGFRDARVMATDARAYCYYMRRSSVMHSADKKLLREVIDDYTGFYKSIADGGMLAGLPKECVSSFVMVHIQSVILTRMFSAGFSPKELKAITARCDDAGVFPLPYIPNRIIAMLYWLARHPVAGWLFSFPFRHIYLRYIK